MTVGEFSYAEMLWLSVCLPSMAGAPHIPHLPSMAGVPHITPCLIWQVHTFATVVFGSVSPTCIRGQILIVVEYYISLIVS